jgi:hypothetical protein
MRSVASCRFFIAPKSPEKRKNRGRCRAFIGGCPALPNIQALQVDQPRSRIFEACGPF